MIYPITISINNIPPPNITTETLGSCPTPPLTLVLSVLLCHTAGADVRVAAVGLATARQGDTGGAPRSKNHGEHLGFLVV